MRSDDRAKQTSRRPRGGRFPTVIGLVVGIVGLILVILLLLLALSDPSPFHDLLSG
ncbi:MAG TPA: hypothetical protein VIL93_05850 [Solirubrobacterales bacterium]|jgi:hypothetical protein|nr:hypothetical protein [Actinomycetota bacterium]